MSYAHYDRLSALDATFLEIEEASVHMHVAAIAIFEAGPVTTREGILDIQRINSALEAALCQSPRFRQKLEHVPVLGHPVWVDDHRFNLSYHLRHTSLPRPGDSRLLKRLVGRILSQKLDRGKPLWEMWLVEGVEEDRFAIVIKAHHCMVDGISGLDLLAGLLSLAPKTDQERPSRWQPRPLPGGPRLLADELLHRAGFPLSLLGSLARGLTQPAAALAEMREAMLGLSDVVKAGLEPTAATPLNPDIGPYRRFDWTRIDLAAVREVKERLGGTVNDVVLTTAAGAIGGFLRERGFPFQDGVFRAQIPVSVRSSAERGDAGNRVAMLLAELPVEERDPRRRLERVIETTRRLKRSRQRAGVEFLEDLGNRTLTSLWVSFARLATWQRSFNVVITNVPGPQQPLYLLGAKLREIYPVVPLANNQALGVALFSYDGGLYWGLNSDWDAMPDLHDLALGIDEEFERLRKAALEGPSA